MNFRSGIFNLILLIVILFPVALSSQEDVYVVQRGDTIFSIARSFDIDRDELMRVNGITDPTRLQVGQRLFIPEPVVVTGGSDGNRGELLYRVVQGDTFYGIARRYGLTVNQLLAANSLPSNYVLRQGDMLRIPGTHVPGTQVPGTQAPEARVPEVQGIPELGPLPSQLPIVTAVQRPTETRAPDPSVRWPVVARELSYMAGNAGGVIITGERAEPVISLSNGTVISAGPYRGYGRVVIVQTTGGYIYVYGGFEVLTVREGDRVALDAEMGRLGIDAVTGKPQLFFRVYLNNAPIDPALAPRA